jgi:hypothetical protein
MEPADGASWSPRLRAGIQVAVQRDKLAAASAIGLCHPSIWEDSEIAMLTSNLSMPAKIRFLIEMVMKSWH